jgi:hypothetical protein
MTTTDRRAGLGWPSDAISGAAPDESPATTSGIAAGLGWPVEAPPAGSARTDDATHDEEHA